MNVNLSTKLEKLIFLNIAKQGFEKSIPNVKNRDISLRWSFLGWSTIGWCSLGLRQHKLFRLSLSRSEARRGSKMWGSMKLYPLWLVNKQAHTLETGEFIQIALHIMSYWFWRKLPCLLIAYFGSWKCLLLPRRPGHTTLYFRPEQILENLWGFSGFFFDNFGEYPTLIMIINWI